VSVIVPVRRINDYVRESFPHVMAQTGVTLEWICLPDVTDTGSDGIAGDGDRVSVVATGAVGPARKRDIGAQIARGRILAFLDDDAYPTADWLQAALPHFEDTTVAAVGGPGVTPPSDGFWKQVSGWVFASRLGSGGARNRYLPVGGVRDVDDWPSMNLLVRASDFAAVGGFDCEYFPGEDTKLCLELVYRLGKRIVYEPRAMVLHHRRDLFWGHYRQVGRYGQHRGHFVRRLPETSRRPVYFAPTALVALIVTYPVVLIAVPRLAGVWRVVLGAYLFALAATAVEVAAGSRSASVGVASAMGVMLTHLWYGAQFAVGLASQPRLPGDLNKD
jgi:glycosyltransferase involved in cell wall biosynthesis